MNEAFFLSVKKDVPARGYWDQGLVEDLLSGRLWKPPHWEDFKISEKVKKCDRAIVIIPGAYQFDVIDEINKQLSKIKRVVVFVTSDEENKFPIHDLKHDNMVIYMDYPVPGIHDDINKIGTGYPTDIHDFMPEDLPEKDLNVFFSGQITHRRRIRMIEAMRQYELEDKNTLVNKTKGFTQGYGREEYYRNFLRSKISPAPSGIVHPDSFRLFEALECMSIPIADEKNPDKSINEYWDWLFDEPTPFPKVLTWTSAIGHIQESLLEYPHNLHKITSWWINWKREFVYEVMEELNG